jgi:SAM-dependent methyltransferase
MREHVTATVDRILSLQPRRVLEIGCGPGLLAFELIRRCQDYFGIDSSQTAIAQLQKLQRSESLWELVPGLDRASFVCCRADRIGDLGCDVDVAILPSVVQYFPSLDYFEKVLHTLVDMLAPDGCIFIGDVRNLELLEDSGVEGLIPERQSFEENPAKRADPTQPVAEAEWAKLPVNPQAKVLDKAAFIYVPEQDCYFCPLGKALAFTGTRKYQRENCQGVYKVYQGKQCGDCPLKGRCVPAKSKARSIYRDEYDAVRKRTAERLESEAGQQAYRRRWPLAEGRFGVIKAVLGVRQFLLRGIEKVGMEWTWTAAAYNLKVMLRSQLERKGVPMAMA